MKKVLLVFVFVMFSSCFYARVNVTNINSMGIDSQLLFPDRLHAPEMIGLLGYLDVHSSDFSCGSYHCWINVPSGVSTSVPLYGPGSPHWGQCLGSTAEILFNSRLLIDLDSYGSDQDAYLEIPSTYFIDNRTGLYTSSEYDSTGNRNMRCYYYMIIHYFE